MKFSIFTLHSLSVPAALCMTLSAHAADFGQVPGLQGAGVIDGGVDPFWSGPVFNHGLGMEDSKHDTLMHTDVPDLPRAGTDDPLPDFGSFSIDGWTPDLMDPRGKPSPQLFDTIDLVRAGMTLELSGNPNGGGVIRGGPGRVHTDVPDLPGLAYPPVSHMPPSNPGLNDWGDDMPQKPRLASSTIPTPASILVLGLGTCVAVRRRR